MSVAGVSQTAHGAVAYTVSGAGSPVVLLHPIGMDGNIWSSFVQRWHSRYRLIVVDMLGHGNSSSIGATCSLSIHASAIVEVMRQEGVQGAVVVGVSMGGMVAQRVAIQAPELVRGLVLCATAGSFPAAARMAIRARGDAQRQGSMEEVIPSTLARWLSPGATPELIDQTYARLASDDWYSWSKNWEAIAELENLTEIASLEVPALVVAGDADASIPISVTRQIADTMRNATFVVIEGASHFGAYESPEVFIPLFEEFIDSWSPCRPRQT